MIHGDETKVMHCGVPSSFGAENKRTRYLINKACDLYVNSSCDDACAFGAPCGDKPVASRRRCVRALVNIAQWMTGAHLISCHLYLWTPESALKRIPLSPTPSHYSVSTRRPPRRALHTRNFIVRSIIPLHCINARTSCLVQYILLPLLQPHFKAIIRQTHNFLPVRLYRCKRFFPLWENHPQILKGIIMRVMKSSRTMRACVLAVCMREYV